MTVEGYIAARVMEGSYDAEQFYDFVVEEVVSSCSCQIVRSWGSLH